MAAFVIVRKDSYHDSVLLMRISQELKRLDQVEDAVVAMGTPANRELLEQNGYGCPELRAAGPNDLVIAVKGVKEAVPVAEAAIARLLQPPAGAADEAAIRPSSLSAAIRGCPETNLVLISVPGDYAAAEARRALALGRHVMLFSSNVSTEDEIALKKMACERGLLCMGPDCGTAIINGKPLGFANVVRRGSIGIVGAAGTGIQEVSSCIHRLGGGISQAIGVGGRDLSDAVGGLMTLLGIEALAGDPATKVIVVVSKPPSPEVSERVVAALSRSSKPGVVHFVGMNATGRQSGVLADSLAGAAEAACRKAGVSMRDEDTGAGSRDLPDAPDIAPGAKLRALFCGGTLGHEALAILSRAKLEVRSNLHKGGPLHVTGTAPVSGHLLLDLGDEIFTQGRPHPMIEPVLRNQRLIKEAADPEAGLFLFDLVLGYGAHPDPAGVLVEGIARAREIATARTRGGGKSAFLVIASVTGTPDDPQDYRAQARRLEEAGVTVLPDNRSAAEFTARCLGGKAR